MNELFQYLLRGKRGIIATVLTPVCITLIFSVVRFGIGLPSCLYYLNDPGLNLTAEEIAYCKCYMDGGSMEWVCAFVAAVCFWWLCDKIFRCGTANGVSRASVIKTTLICVPAVALPAALLSGCIRLFWAHCTPYCHYDSLYTTLCGRSVSSMAPNLAATIEELETRSVQKSWTEVELYAVLYFCGALCILLALLCGIYALRRKYGSAGLVIGICAAVTLWALAVVPVSSGNSAYAQAIKRMFFTQQGDMLTYFQNGKVMFMHPNTGSFLLLAVVLIVVFMGIYWFFLRKAGIKPET